jgi:hypothetical protein
MLSQTNHYFFFFASDYDYSFYFSSNYFYSLSFKSLSFACRCERLSPTALALGISYFKTANTNTAIATYPRANS